MSDDLSRVGGLEHSAECLCDLHLNVMAVRSHDELSKFLKEIIARALTESGAVSGSVFLIDRWTAPLYSPGPDFHLVRKKRAE